MTNLELEILETLRQLSPERIKIALLSAALSASAAKDTKQHGGILPMENQAYLLPDEEIRDLSEAAPFTEGGTVEDLLNEAAVVRDAVERAISELSAGPARMPPLPTGGLPTGGESGSGSCRH